MERERTRRASKTFSLFEVPLPIRLFLLAERMDPRPPGRATPLDGGIGEIDSRDSESGENLVGLAAVFSESRGMADLDRPSPRGGEDDPCLLPAYDISCTSCEEE